MGLHSASIEQCVCLRQCMHLTGLVTLSRWSRCPTGMHACTLLPWCLATPTLPRIEHILPRLTTRPKAFLTSKYCTCCPSCCQKGPESSVAAAAAADVAAPGPLLPAVKPVLRVPGTMANSPMSPAWPLAQSVTCSSTQPQANVNAVGPQDNRNAVQAQQQPPRGCISGAMHLGVLDPDERASTAPIQQAFIAVYLMVNIRWQGDLGNVHALPAQLHNTVPHTAP